MSRYVLMALLLGACATPRRAAPAPVLSMGVDVMPAEGQGVGPLLPGGRVREGDHFSVCVEAGAPAYLYLVHGSAAGQRVLDPAAGAPARQLRPGKPAHLPREGWYEADNRAGAEDLWLVASARPLAPGQVTAALAGPVARPPSLGRGGDTKGMDETHRGEGMEGVMDPGGVTLLRFPLHHE